MTRSIRSIRVLTYVFLCLTMASLAYAQTAQERSASVMGYVWTANNAAIADATVQLRDVVTGVVTATTTTNAVGEFMFETRAGSYVLEYVGAAGNVLAMGHPFTVAPGETTATFIRLGNALPLLTSRRAIEVALGAVSVWREGSAGGAPGGGIALGLGSGRLTAVIDASGSRRDGHTDWRALGGARFWLSDTPSRGFFLTAMGGALARSSKAGFALAAGAGAELRGSGRFSLRLQADAIRDRAQSVERSGVRGSLWLVVR